MSSAAVVIGAQRVKNKKINHERIEINISEANFKETSMSSLRDLIKD